MYVHTHAHTHTHTHTPAVFQAGRGEIDAELARASDNYTKPIIT